MDLHDAHERLPIVLAIIAPNNNLQDTMRVIVTEYERLLVERVQRVAQCSCLELGQTLLVFHQVNFHVDSCAMMFVCYHNVTVWNRLDGTD